MMITALSTLGQSDLLRSEFTGLEGQIQQLQNQVATGEKAAVFGDLGSQASLDINLRQKADLVDNYKKSIGQLTVRTNLVDKALGIIRDTALGVQNEAFQIPSFPSQRQDVVSAAKAAIDQITDRLQTSVNGRNLFGGTDTQGNPVIGSSTLLPAVQAAVTAALAATPAPTDIPAAIRAAVGGVFSSAAAYYTGGPPHAPTQIDQGLGVDYSITGADPAFQTILTGLYTLAALPQPAGQAATLPGITEGQFDATAQAAASQVATGLSQLGTLVEKNGRNQKLLADESTAHDATLTLLQTQIDNVESVDITDATTRLTQLRIQLEASFHITASLNNLNLVDLLK